ncbi:DUF1992 domain-containing protein [Bacillus sp. AGMB 02131]|uniref:DUF1992 domain-containing protein n=1 Tax=Peribacillus faecalis TaxID=2772559 RepID=A0A927HC45_9BACI|nr:DnaJ family domain-containing protein [Peribacillus faecalis]MBD3109629.1 DUF1992 domain-containing protein [Peribacillus faecalis]
MDRQYNDLIGDILAGAGEKADSKKKGNPISKEYLQMDTYQHFQKIAKDAGFLPPWLKLQKEIAELVHLCTTPQEIDNINEKIRKHNKICPTQMQRGLVSFERLGEAKKYW